MKTLLTHNGTFHADDVFAAATFLLAHPGEDWQIVRSRDKAQINQAEAVLDVGDIYDPKNMRFDHHQDGGAGVRENGIPYAACGLVWKELGAVVCGGDFFVAKQIDDGLVSSMDAHDNGVKLYDELYSVSPYELSQYVKIWNHTWKEEQEAGNNIESSNLEVFTQLVEWAKSLITREITRFKDKNSAFDLVKVAYEDSEDKRIVILEKFYPWQSAISEYPEPLYVVYPTIEGKWAAKAVPVREGSFDSRKPFPESWAGKRDAELASVSGVSDASFCHNGRFLVVAGSKEGAIALANKSLNS